MSDLAPPERAVASPFGRDDGRHGHGRLRIAVTFVRQRPIGVLKRETVDVNVFDKLTGRGVTVIARENGEVKSMRHMFLYRHDSQATASTAPN